MAALEDLTVGSTVRGVLPDIVVNVVSTKWFGNNALELTYKDASGKLNNVVLYRENEPALEIVVRGRPWSFSGDGSLFRLASEANRIRLAYIFDPLLAVHTSLVEPLPHQITAVYEHLLTRQPLRFLLADDPGAGKTIMAGLFLKELIARGDLHRCLICCPGSLAEQWQDELRDKFHLDFRIITRDTVESSVSGNPFQENNLIICRLDHLSRNEELQAKLEQTDWDLVICDEAHKMSATFFGGEVKYTKRYRLGQLLSQITRHFLLMTATPHNGKEEDFQLFMALLDGDRFEGKFRDGAHTADTSDLMRRMVKEQLVKFDGRPLFPERRAYPVEIELSDEEAYLYKRVTDYVRDEFNRADALENDGRRGTVGFALTVLQRRLASSPEAIYQSLKRRKERLEKRLREEQILKRGGEVALTWQKELPEMSEDDFDDLDDAPDSEVEEAEERMLDQATAARTIAELEVEISLLADLEGIAADIRRSGKDCKWEQLSALLGDSAEMFGPEGSRRKLVIFTEHRDTLSYLVDRIRTYLHSPEAVVTIHGGMGREDRRKAEQAFLNDPTVLILVATDAAGEGLNLQRAHLMVNYDLPWNPNRIEQRFGRIHRIGQTEVCHLWNLIAKNTREGEVYLTLLQKLERETAALGDKVFDVLGKAVSAKDLRTLMIESIRYGDQPEVRERMLRKVESELLDHERIVGLYEEQALTRDTMDTTKVQRIREEMQRAEARRLQPHFIATFFLEAFKQLGGTLREREPDRYEVTHVPAMIRSRDRLIGAGAPVLQRYERIAFEKTLLRAQGKPGAAFVCPGHPLLDATIDLVLERNADLLRQGAILVDPNDFGKEPRVLVYLEHDIQDARSDRSGNHRVISRRMQFVEIGEKGEARIAGYAPYLDYRPLSESELEIVQPVLDTSWVKQSIEDTALSHAIEQIVPEHLQEVKKGKEELIHKTMAAVKDRLTKEITHWTNRAEALRLKEIAGKFHAKLNSTKAQQRADELEARLQKRMKELEQELRISPKPPVVTGAALVIPLGLLYELRGEQLDQGPDVQARAAVELKALEAVIEAERAMGHEPRNISHLRLPWDIESRLPAQGDDPSRIRFIEVKGRWAGAPTVTVSKNEILTALNKPEDYVVAVVKVDGAATELRYVWQPFTKEPDFGVTSVNYDLGDLWSKGVSPTG